MTELREDRVAPADREPSGIVASRGAHAPGHRRAVAGGQGPSGRWMAGFFAILAVVLVLAAGLAYVGLSTVRSSRAGRVISTITDPAAPGFEALVEPSPTLLVVDKSPRGGVRSLAVLALNAGDQGGAALLLPPATIGGDHEGAIPIDAVAAFSGAIDDVRVAVQDAITAGIAEAVEVDDARWAELVAPVAPLAIENPTPVGSFPAGTVQLEADDVPAWLAASAPGETELDRLRRSGLLWRAWIEAVSTHRDDPAVVPGEVEGGLGRFVRGLAAGPLRVEQVPVSPVPSPQGRSNYVSDLAATRALVDELVPFPTGSTYAPRVRVRLLDGTGDQQHVGKVASRLIRADAELVVAGNADGFDYERSEVRYHDPQGKAEAVALQEALGAGKVVEDPRPTEAFDVTIILGTDA